MNSEDSIFNYLESDNRDQSKIPKADEEIPPFKAVCCMKYAIEKQCKRCPFRQIEDAKEQAQALKECREKRRGTYHYENLNIEYNSKYW
ncbi:MAG: hypothetical protein P1V18_05820 [Candidatus Gracilibacteria bacterium]|nr:hypothetical protein [Candidatus Gracilibacteria bacterium]